ncbi:TPA: YiiX/YebB-like N1pC/P60 family cysteine hydrolase [Vibrio campbellii]
MLPGDVLLISGKGKISKTLITAQKAIYPNAKSSHVELSLGDGVFIHATSDSGVHITILTDEDKACNGEWRVIRHKSITELGSVTQSLQIAATYHAQQGYNKVFMGKGNDHSSFCSELVAKSYAKTGINIINGKQPSKVTPAHFDKEADQLIDWIDVTAEYQTLLTDMKLNEFQYRMVAGLISNKLKIRQNTEAFRDLFLEALEGGTEVERNKADRLKAMLGERELKFWYEKKK